MSAVGQTLRRGAQTHEHSDRRTMVVSGSLAARSLDRIGDLSFAIAVIVVPLSTAVVRESGVAVFICCSLLMGFAWAIREVIEPASQSNRSGAELIILGAIFLVCLQLMRLPPDVLHTFSPFIGANLESWGVATKGVAAASTWETISLTPELTKSGLVLLLAYSIFFMTLLQRIKSTAHVDRCLKIVAIAAVVMAVIGLAQVLTGSNEFLWMFEHPARSAKWPVKGTFTNQNHFAHFLALGMGPLIWWWHSSRTEQSSRPFSESRHRRQRQTSQSTHTIQTTQIVLTLAIAVVALAGLGSTSRGGIAALLVATVIALVAIGVKWRNVLTLAVPVALFVIAGSMEIGTEKLQEKWNSITGASSVNELTSGRTVLWQSVAEAVPHFWRTGSGLGSHAEVYPIWMKQHFNVRFSHAECGYLQVLLELGLPGALLLLCGIGLCCSWIFRTYRHSTTDSGRQRALIVASGIVASLLHSTVDFVWYLPGCLIPTLVIAACACRHWQQTDASTEQKTSTTTRWPTVLAWLLLILAVPVGQFSAAEAGHDAASEADWLAGRDRALSDDDRILHLESCLKRDPSDYSAMSKLAGMYLDRFHRKQADAANNMTAMQLRCTVRSTEFESHRELAEWLVRAFGNHSADLYRAHRLAQKSLLGQPLKGESYAILSQVGFLLGMTEQTEDALLQQAMTIRPYEAFVHYQVGLTLASKGQFDAACQSLSQAFAIDARLRPTIVKELSLLIPADEFIRQLRPEADGLWLLFRAYESQGKVEDQRVVADWYSKHIRELTTSQDSQTPEFWKRSETIFSFAGDAEQAVYCLNKLVKSNPTDIRARKNLAQKLLQIGQYKQCRAELEWCLLRTPDDTEIKASLVTLNEILQAGESE